MSFPANLHDSCAASNLTDYRRVREVLTGNQWILTIKLMFPVSLFQKQNQWIYLSHLSIIISLIISLSCVRLCVLLTSSLVITWSMANREGRDPLVWNRHLIFQFSRNSHQKKHQNGVTFVRKHHFPLMNAQKGVAPMVRRYISTWYLCFEDCCATRSPCWEPGSPTIDRLAGWHGRWLGHFRYPKLLMWNLQNRLNLERNWWPSNVFASQADASVGNVTGSNSVNVFLGLGMSTSQITGADTRKGVGKILV
jgi:hypothetical protein